MAGTPGLATWIGTEPVQLVDGVNLSVKASVGQFHNADQQVPPATGGSLLTGGVPQLTDIVGLSNRQRQAGQDGVAAIGQLAIPLAQEFQGSITAGNLTANTASPGYALPNVGTGFQVTPSSTSGWKVGAIGLINDANPEPFEVVSVASTTANIIGTGTNGAFKFTHTAPYTYVSLFVYNQERDFAGEGPCVAPSGAAVAVEFESNSGGPPLASGLASGFTLDTDRNLQGKGSQQMAVTATVAGSSTIQFTNNPWTSGLIISQPLILSVGANGAAVEEVIVGKNNVPVTGAGPITVNLASPIVNANSTFATFDAFAVNGPGTSGASALGVEDNGTYVFNPAAADPKRPLFLTQQGQLTGSELTSTLPANATAQNTSATTAVGGAISTTIPAGAAGVFSYLTGFDITTGIAAAAATVLATIAGLANTLNYSVSANTTGSGTVLSVRFKDPLKASAAAQAITISLPAIGGAAAVNSISAYGFQQ